MKKLLYLLLLLPLGFLSSCNDDESFPSVNIQMTVENAVNVDGHLYIVNGEPFQIASITAEGTNGQTSAVASMSYFLDGNMIGYSIVAPYTAEIPANLMYTGNHLVELSFKILQVDKNFAYGGISNLVTVVESEADLPAGTTLGTVVLNYSINPQ